MTRTETPSGKLADVGQEYDITITAIGVQGDGITRVEDNLVVFVPKTSVGQKCKIRITRRFARFALGEAV